MIILPGKNIYLRDLIKSDIETRIKWETTITEWQLWDGPWEYENLTEDERKDELSHYIEHLRDIIEKNKTRSDSDFRHSFQIVTNDNKPIGWVSSYYLDDNYCYCDEKTNKIAIGIDIPDPNDRHKGYGKNALLTYIEYLKNNGYEEVYTQTWSGNEKMINLALSMGFKVIKVKENLRFVRGHFYDGLSFYMKVK